MAASIAVKNSSPLHNQLQLVPQTSAGIQPVAYDANPDLQWGLLACAKHGNDQISPTVHQSGLTRPFTGCWAELKRADQQARFGRERWLPHILDTTRARLAEFVCEGFHKYHRPERARFAEQ